MNRFTHYRIAVLFAVVLTLLAAGCAPKTPTDIYLLHSTLILG